VREQAEASPPRQPPGHVPDALPQGCLRVSGAADQVRCVREHGRRQRL